MTASQAFCCVSLRLPHIRPARWNPAGGKLDQRCFWAVSVQANKPVCFSVSFSVARKAFAAATILGVASCAVLDVVDPPVVDVVATVVVVGAVAVVAIVAVVAPVAVIIPPTVALVGVAAALATVGVVDAGVAVVCWLFVQLATNKLTNNSPMMIF